MALHPHLKPLWGKGIPLWLFIVIISGFFLIATYYNPEPDIAEKKCYGIFLKPGQSGVPKQIPCQENTEWLG